MQFHISEQKIRKDRHRSILLIVVLLCLSVALLGKATLIDKGADLLLPIVGLLIFAPAIYVSYRHIQQGAAAYPSLTLDEENHQIAVCHQGAVVKIALLQNTSLRLQSRFGRVASIIVKTDAGQILKFAGYDNMETLVATLERLMPADKISSTSFLHQ